MDPSTTSVKKVFKKYINCSLMPFKIRNKKVGKKDQTKRSDNDSINNMMYQTKPNKEFQNSQKLTMKTTLSFFKKKMVSRL